MQKNTEFTEDIIYNPDYQRYQHMSRMLNIENNRISTYKNKKIKINVGVGLAALLTIIIVAGGYSPVLTFLGSGILITSLSISTYYGNVIRKSTRTATDLYYKVGQMAEKFTRQQFQSQMTNSQSFDSVEPDYNLGSDVEELGSSYENTEVKMQEPLENSIIDEQETPAEAAIYSPSDESKSSQRQHRLVKKEMYILENKNNYFIKKSH